MAKKRKQEPVVLRDFNDLAVLLEGSRSWEGLMAETKADVTRLNFGYVTATLRDSMSGGDIGYEYVRRPELQESEISAEFESLYARPNSGDVVVDGLTLAPGICAVFGPARRDKSPLVSYIVEKGGGAVVDFGEPVKKGSSRASDAAISMLQLMMDPTMRFIGVDSIKNLLGRDSGGGLGSKGIPRSVWPMLSDWGHVGAKLGCTIVTSVNISTDDEKAIGEVMQAIKSNTTTALISTAKREFLYESRVVGKEGEAGSLRVNWGADHITGLSVRKMGASLDGDGVEEVLQSAVVGKDELQRIFSRLSKNRG